MTQRGKFKKDGFVFAWRSPRRSQSFHEQFKPVGGFLGFAKEVAAFGDEPGSAPRTICFAIVRSNGCCRAKSWFTKDSRIDRFG